MFGGLYFDIPPPLLWAIFDRGYFEGCVRVCRGSFSTRSFSANAPLGHCPDSVANPSCVFSIFMVLCLRFRLTTPRGRDLTLSVRDLVMIPMCTMQLKRMTQGTIRASKSLSPVYPSLPPPTVALSRSPSRLLQLSELEREFLAARQSQN